MIEKKPRNYMQVLETYQRCSASKWKSARALIETATELSPEAGAADRGELETQIRHTA